jgi:hypothetical protein
MKTQFNFTPSRSAYPAAGSITFPDLPGYAVTVEYDESPQNPFEAWDGEPPLAYFSERWNGPTAEDVFDCIPEALAAKRYKDILAAIGDYTGDHKGVRFGFADSRKAFGVSRYDALREAVREAYDPTGWRTAENYIELLETLASIAGIAYHSTVSRDYSQGDKARLFTFASPEWVKLTGAPEDSHAAQLSAACDLWTAWAWGDVYGIAEIVGPDGEEIEDASVWGFYGSDHDASGLVDAARDAIAAHARLRAREAEAAHDAACRDVATVTA